MGRRPPFAAIYRDHFAEVMRSVRFWGVHERHCEDVAQDVFVTVHASLDRYDASRPLRPWLKCIAYRVARDFRESAPRRRELLTAEEEALDPVDTAPSPERAAQLRQAQRVLIDLLRELSEEHREVLLMHTIDEIEIPEIAALLAIPENTVRSRLHRAHVAFDRTLSMRRDAEARRGTGAALMPMLMPAALFDAGRAPLDVDPAMMARVWGRLSRVLGLGVVGALAPLSGAAISAGAALLFALGAVGGALGMRAMMPPGAPDPVVRPEPRPVDVSTALPAATMGMSAPTVTVPASAEPEADAGAPPRVDSLRAEQGYLDRAWSAYQAGSYEAALREIGRHERAYPNGALAARRRELKQQVLEAMAAGP